MDNKYNILKRIIEIDVKNLHRTISIIEKLEERVLFLECVAVEHTKIMKKLNRKVMKLYEK